MVRRRGTLPDDDEAMILLGLEVRAGDLRRIDAWADEHGVTGTDVVRAAVERLARGLVLEPQHATAHEQEAVPSQ